MVRISHPYRRHPRGWGSCISTYRPDFAPPKPCVVRLMQLPQAHLACSGSYAGSGIARCFALIALLPAMFALPTSVSSVPAKLSTTSTIATPTTFPVIYVARAVIDCGAPLLQDVCSTSFFDSLFHVATTASGQAMVTTRTSHYIHAITKTVTSIVTILPSANCTTSMQTLISTFNYTLVSTLKASLVTTSIWSSPAHTLMSISTSISISITRLAEETSYKPSLIRTSGPALPNALPGQGILNPRFISKFAMSPNSVREVMTSTRVIMFPPTMILQQIH